MNELQVFSNPAFGEVRTVEENGNILFLGSDVAKALGYSNPTKAVNDHCKKMFVRRANDSLGRQQDMTFISEFDLYRMVASSNLPSAQKFEAWLFEDVVPSIRKHGAYLTPAVMQQLIADPAFGIQLFTALQDEQTKRKQLEAETDRQKAVIIVLTDGISLSDKRKILNRVVRKDPNHCQERWNMLYRHFEDAYGINIERRMDNYVRDGGKVKSKLDYVDKRLGKLDELYGVAVKLFETDVNKVKKELFS